jgi:hydroxypyruvate isomerase
MRRMPKFNANLSMMFTEVDFLDRFAEAADVGFKGVEFLFPYDWPAAAIGERLQAGGLTQVLFNLPPGDWEAGERGLAALPGRQAEFQDSLGRALDYAAALDCRQVHCMAGVAAPGMAPEAMEETFVDNLRRAAGAAAERGVRLLIEPLNTRDVPGYLLCRSADARRIIEATGSDNVFLQYDLYHMQIMEGDLAATIDANLDVIRHFQVSSVPGRHEPPTGEVNVAYLFDRIDAGGYDGWIGCEYHPATTTREGLAWLAPWGIGA